MAASFDLDFFEDLDGDGIYNDQMDNLLGQTSYSEGLGIGASAWVSATVSGTVLFRDNLIYVWVDSAGTIPESDETNNLGYSGSRCEFYPPVGVFSPTLELEWTGSPTLPTSYQVMMAPIVTDLSADGIPDIAFTTFQSNQYYNNGHCP